MPRPDSWQSLDSRVRPGTRTSELARVRHEHCAEDTRAQPPLAEARDSQLHTGHHGGSSAQATLCSIGMARVRLLLSVAQAFPVRVAAVAGHWILIAGLTIAALSVQWARPAAAIVALASPFIAFLARKPIAEYGNRRDEFLIDKLQPLLEEPIPSIHTVHVTRWNQSLEGVVSVEFEEKPRPRRGRDRLPVDHDEVAERIWKEVLASNAQAYNDDVVELASA